MYPEAEAAFAKESADPERVVNALAGLASTHAYAGKPAYALQRLLN